MQTVSDRTFEPRSDLQAFVEDYCGCGVEPHSDPVSEACDDAALMLALQQGSRAAERLA